MVDDDKLSNDLSLLPDLSNNSSPTPFGSVEFGSPIHVGSVEFDSSIHDLLNLDVGDSSELFQDTNPFLDSLNVLQEEEKHPQFDVVPESPKLYFAPRAMLDSQDSFSLDSRVDCIEDARILPDSPRLIQDLGVSSLRVPGSPRAFVHPRSSGSPRFGSPTSPVLIDTAAPFESVKEAVSKFGGITDWKAHKIQKIERRKTVDQELEKVQEDTPEYKKKAVEAEEAKQRVMIELESTRNVIELLKLELEKAEKEEQQAKQDSDLAKLRVEEMEQGIADEASVATKAQLELAKERHLSAVTELGSVREEIEMFTTEYESLLKDKDLASKKAEDSVLGAKEIEKKMESLAIEVITAKTLLESAHVTHLESEEKKMKAIMARDQEVYNQEKELKMVEDEIERLKQEIHGVDDVKIKIETASALEQDLRAEIAAYKDSNDNFVMGKRTNSDIQAAVDSAKKELEEVKANIEKANSEVKTLKIIVGSLQSELGREIKDLSETREREASFSQRNCDETRDDKSLEIAKKLQEACREAEEAKSVAAAVREELRKAKEESEQAKTGVAAVESQLTEAKKEMEAARASEKLALAAIKALQETQFSKQFEDISSSPRSVVISVEEYYELSKQAHLVDEAANKKLAEIVSQIEAAKEEESRILEKLEEVKRETFVRREELKEAMGKVEKARDGKAGMEHELRKWSSENGGMRSPGASPEVGNDFGKSKSAVHKPSSYEFGEQASSTVGDTSNSVTPEIKKKKKRFSMIPKVFMFLSRKKSNK